MALPKSIVATVLTAASICLSAPAATQPAPAPAASQASATAQPVDSGKVYGYAIGADIGNSVQRVVSMVDVNSVIQGISDKLLGKPTKYSTEEMKTILQQLQAKFQKMEEGKNAAAGEENIKAGQAFLKDNGKKPGVKTTASGLQYKVLTLGKGVKPKASDKVKVHYKGTLIDGTTFDSSIERGEPISFELGGVIKGWTEGLQLMPVGSKFQFVIPSELAYGATPRPGGPIGPNAVLVFEVELLDIEKPAK